MVSGEEESWDVNEKEVVDWRDSDMEVAKEESFGTDTLSAQDGQTTGSTEAKRGFFHTFVRFFAFDGRSKSLE